MREISQWMTSGKGIIHSERPPKKVTDKGGIQEFIQLWVNIPAENKMTNPSYQNIQKKNFPNIKLDKGEGVIQLIAGELNKIKGPTKTFSPIMALKREFYVRSRKKQ